MKRLLLLLGMISTLVIACGKSGGDEFDENAELSLTSTSVTFSGEGGEKNVVFQATGFWKLYIPEDATWLTASAYKGDGQTKRQAVTLIAEANPDATVRSTTVTMDVGSTQKTIKVSQDECVVTISPSDVPDLDKIYIPQEFSGMDFFRSDSKWSFIRSKQSEHCIVFWDIKYGATGTPTPTDCKKSSMRVDIDDLLYKAELFYEMNVHTLKFVDIDAGDQCCLNKYKFEIYLIYQDEWLATGSGYDNKIGALWVNPSTCQPVGSTIAHEIGHSFQYMVYCDYLLRGGTDNSKGPGWRYGYESDGSGGNAFWEQSAQWQSYQNFDENNNYIRHS